MKDNIVKHCLIDRVSLKLQNDWFKTHAHTRATVKALEKQT